MYALGQEGREEAQCRGEPLYNVKLLFCQSAGETQQVPYCL